LKTLAFTKMHGLGNDFMVIDATTQPFHLTAEQIQAAGDRHLGVGFDQLLVLAPSPSNKADFHYLIFNNDGSAAEQCGNGARCIAKFIRQKNLSDKDELKLLTHDKITRVRLDTDESVTVEINEPSFAPAAIPFITENATPPYQLSIAGKKIQFYVANIGNPHAFILTDKIDMRMVNEIGQLLSIDSHFPQGVNVGFMQIISANHLQLRVYERAAGMTLACGSGAIAAAAVGRKLGLLQEQVKVTQPGGELWISWKGAGSPIFMRGPAKFVYEGKLFLTAN
jgi:diaminopimelate epimerase